MNKREKEVMQAQLDSEKAVLKKLETQYQRALNDINQKVKLFDSDIKGLDTLLNLEGLHDDQKKNLESMKQAKIYQKQYQQALQKQVEGILDKLHGDTYTTVEQYLKECYHDGYIGTMYDIQGQGVPIVVPIDQQAMTKAVVLDSKVSAGYYAALGVGYDRLKKVIPAEVSRGIASSLSYIDIARNIDNASKSGLNNAFRIARTEGHRIQQTATHDAQKAAKAKGADVVKQWDSTLDGRTRPTHRKLDGQIREVDEPFEVDGKKAMMPGDFGRPEEDINCRCVSMTRARWALDEDELETLKERAAFFDLDKTKDFEDFKGKYLKAADEIKKNEDRQAEIRARREAYRKREAAKKKAASLEIPDFHEMKPAQIKEWLDQNIQTKFGDVKGVNKDFLAETAKAVSVFEQKMGGKTIEGLSVKFGGLSGKHGAAYDAKTNTLSLKKTGSVAAFEESLKKDNERTFRKRHKDYHASSTYIGTVFHELGHAVDHDTGQRLSRMLSVDPVLFTESVNVSVYAGAEPALGAPKRSEAWAENFAVYMEGGEKAKEIPQAIVDMIEDYFQRKQ